MACTITFFKFKHKTWIVETYPVAPLARFFFSLSFCRAGIFFLELKLLNPSLTENNGPCLTFFSSETWTDFESESDVSWEIWNEIETEIAAAEEKGNENVSVAVIWTETLI